MIVVRAVTYAAAVVLFGVSLLLAMYSANPLALHLRHRLSKVVGAAALALLGAAAAALPLQAAIAGDGWADALAPGTLLAVAHDTWNGQVTLARIGLAILIVIAQRSWAGGTRTARIPTALLCGLFIASFALTGHAALHEGAIGLAHRLNHALHVLAGSFWLGALLPLAMAANALSRVNERADAAGLLSGFSAAGITAVAIVAATGAANTALVLGRLPADFTSSYQAMLAAKIAAVLVMLALAALNRLALLPRLAQTPDARALRASVLAECVLGALVLGLVAAFGTMEPV